MMRLASGLKNSEVFVSSFGGGVEEFEMLVLGDYGHSAYIQKKFVQLTRGRKGDFRQVGTEG